MDTLQDLYTLGVPIPLLARQFGLSVWRVTDMMQERRRRERAAIAREIRLNRIRANIEAMPNRRLFND